MSRLPFITLAFCLLARQVLAIPTLLGVQSPGEQCRAAISAAERGHAIPPQLMAAIGRVESGKLDPGTGARGAWPWTINAEGEGYYFNSKAEAIQAVQTLRARGVRSIDVGCMQVNLMHHPTAFANLELAFEPAVNADYAARFLVQLYAQTGDWTKATANYHSANPAEGEPYAAKVTSVWTEEQRKAGLAPPPLARPGFAGSFAHPIPERRMYAMAGKMPVGMMQGGSAAGMTGPRISPPGMMQGGTIPAGTLPGGMTNPGVMRVRGTSPGAAPGQALAGAGRGLEFYRAAPVGIMAMPARPAVRMSNKITTR